MPRKKKQPSAESAPQEQKAQEATERTTGEILLSGIDTRLDPGSPDFDRRAFERAVAEAGGVDKLLEKTRQALNLLGEQVTNTVNITEEDRQAANRTIEQAMLNLATFAASETAKKMQANWETFTKAWDAFMYENWDLIAAIADAPEEIRDLVPYIGAAMEEYHMLDGADAPKEKAWQGASLLDVLRDCIDDDGNTNRESIYWPIVERARELLAEDEAAGVFDVSKREQGEKEEPAAPAQSAADISKTLVRQVALQHFVMGNSAVMNALANRKGIINAGALDVPVIPGTKRRKEITVYVIASCDTEDTAEKVIAQRLTEYERVILDTIQSIYEQSTREGLTPSFTIDSLYRATPGRGDRASQAQKDRLERIVTRLPGIRLQLDATDEMQRRGLIKEGERYAIEDQILHLQKHTYTAKNGKQAVAWIIKGEPLMLTYQKQTRNLITAPADHLHIEKTMLLHPGTPEEKRVSTKEPVPMNEQRTAMLSYMYRRIAVMKRDREAAQEKLHNYEKRRAQDKTLPVRTLEDFRKQYDVMLFEAIFADADADTGNRVIEKRNREFCFDALDYWIAKGFITGYAKRMKGRSITGVEILY